MKPGQLISILSLGGLLGLGQAQARDSDYRQPVTIDAGRQLVELADNKVTFIDQVVVKQGSIDVRADELVVIRNEQGLQSMTAKGSPATYQQVLNNGQPVHAEAREIHYDMRARTITLVQDAKLKQNDNIVTGYRIRYFIDKEQMEAESQGGQDRVTTIFLPEQVQDLDNQDQN
ncbi:lipopolysaccharide transport periplasmic protein LptA [Oceanimonas sp. GK1]|uniref:lipopolysaccharide transport periplasmic protein LptA n=1 Tax=Oceanimonas sp. (strain GK1 / IBRC-M 10197) TaxID=511062 RepID=UPI0002494AC5|nr:lipopolysaccharide transport periplasmic protein LptA [Oceanimonas sp. GK1]AEY00591.1 lipopolysaccharide transport periplasmic protein LptA [Oceanimonas sp. GK1]